MGKFLGFCPYCGCGCRLYYEYDKTKGDIVKVLPDKADKISRGRPCLKGLTVNEMMSTNRLNTPLIRYSKDEDLRPCSWEEAFDFIEKNLHKIFENRTGKGFDETQDFVKLRDEVYFLGSGEATNEANYLLSKFVRNCFASNNIDSCARLCHAATAVGFNKIYGMKAIPLYKQDDLEEADLFLFVGTDPMEDYPVLFHRILEAKQNGAQIISLDIGSNSTTQQSDKFIRINPEGITPILAHLALNLIEGKDISRDAKTFKGFREYLASIKEIVARNPISTFGVSREDMDYLITKVDEAKKPAIGFGMGLTQHVQGVQNVLSISSIALLLDAIIFPNRGKINVQGAGDVGADPGWRIEDNEDNARQISKQYGWSDDFASHDGKYMTDALYDSEVKFLWVMGTNPSHSMPHLNLLDKSFKNKFIVYQHHHSGRTMEFADVVLPAKVLSEVNGSVTNGERRVRGFFDRKNRRNAIGDDGASPQNTAGVRSNFDIIKSFAEHIGFDLANGSDEVQIFKELVRVVSGYEKLTYKTVNSNEGHFADKKPKFKHFHKIKYKKDHFAGKGDYPYIFTTARSKNHFCTGEGTRNSKTLMKREGRPIVRISREDANLLGVTDGDKIKITSRVGSIKSEITIDDSLEKRILVAPYHFEKMLVNKLAPLELDPVSGTPCYKRISVNVKAVDK